jgi:predicted DCC family thiol-disulfide oxidoreductase YuxK
MPDSGGSPALRIGRMLTTAAGVEPAAAGAFAFPASAAGTFGVAVSGAACCGDGGMFVLWECAGMLALPASSHAGIMDVCKRSNLANLTQRMAKFPDDRRCHHDEFRQLARSTVRYSGRACIRESGLERSGITASRRFVYPTRLSCMAGSSDDILLVYDRECPFCDAYCRLARVAPEAGTLHLVDARDASPVMQEITQRGLDIDQGMVVKKAGALYYGSDAIHQLALASSRKGLFNRLSYWTFRSRRVAHVLYPMLRACRNFALKLMRKTKINNLGIAGNDRF